MKKLSLLTFLMMIMFSLIRLPATALINTSDLLIVEPGESITLSRTVYRRVTIYVKDGGTINIAPYDGGGANNGQLDLIAPVIIIDGTINGEGTGHNDSGKGYGPSSHSGGGGGGGFGGNGGRGDYYTYHYWYAGAGGSTYDDVYQAPEGSYGWNAGNGTSFTGYGGAGLRLDAMDLAIGSTAVLNVSGYQKSSATVGGGSGGCILLDGINTELQSGALLNIKGGPGGEANTNWYAAGGGGGGRLKIFKRQTLTDAGAVISISGGTGGADGARDGDNGTSAVLDALPLPDAPSQLSPADQATVGLSPTLQFSAHDTTGCKFLRYQCIISKSPAFSTIDYGSTQLAPDDGGWGGRAYYTSDETATYALPISLDPTTPYYWSISVTADNGQTWVDAPVHFKFTTAIVNNKPLVPMIIEPSDSNVDVSKTPAFKIVMADGEGDTMTCQLLISQEPTLANAQLFQSTYSGWDHSLYVPQGAAAGITATCQVLNEAPNLDALIPGVTYYCRATVYDYLQQSRDSTIITFTTVPLPVAPQILSPPTSTIVTSKVPTLQFETASPTSGLLKYELELSSNNFQTLLVFKSDSGVGWTQTTYASGETAVLTIPPENMLISGMDYAWRVRGYDIDNDNWSVFSDISTFTVMTPPFKPELLSPLDNYSAPNSRITFKFKVTSEGGNTMTAKVELSDNAFATIMHDFDQHLSSTGWDASYYQSNSPAAFTIPSSLTLSSSAQYSWRVAFFDGVSWGPFSDVRHFSMAKSLTIDDIKTYPNPAVNNTVLNIFYRLSVNAKVTFKFYNRLGKEVKQVVVPMALGGMDGNTLAVDISTFASGLYFYEMIAESGMGTRKSVKQFAVVR